MSDHSETPISGGKTQLRWAQRLDELAAYVSEHDRIPPTTLKPLGHWLSAQRAAARKGTLSEERRLALDERVPGWMTPAKRSEREELRWAQRLEELAAYVSEHDRIPPTDLKLLGRWLSAQRAAARKGVLSAERRKGLDERVPGWMPSATVPEREELRWAQRLDELVAYIDEHGSLPPVRQTPLGRWLGEQRRASTRKGTLSEERRLALDERAPGWTTSSTLSGEFQLRWVRFLDELVAYADQHEGCLPTHDTAVGQWLGRQRQMAKRGTINPGRARELDDRVPGWRDSSAKLRDQWARSMEDVAAYVDEHGKFPNKRAPGGIGRWLGEQRRAAREGHLDAGRRRILDDRLPDWLPDVETPERRAETMVAAIVEHVEKSGTLPERESAPGNWLHYQRYAERSGALRVELHRELDERVPGWNTQGTREHRWEEKFAQLEAYVNEHGHRPPQNKKSSFGIWIGNQIAVAREGRLDPERRRRLDDLSPGWDTPIRPSWEERLDELGAYVAEHDRLPSTRLKPLGMWLNTQRAAVRKGSLPEERRRALDERVPGWLSPR